MARKKGLMGLAQARSGDLNPIWGAIASGGLGTASAIGVRAMTGMDKNAELIGLGVGVAAGLGLMASERSRAAGVVGIVTALMNNGMRFAEAAFSAKQQIKDLAGAKATFVATKAATRVPMSAQLDVLKAEGAAAGFGVTTAERRHLGAYSAEQRHLGAVSAEAVRSFGAASAEQRQLGIVSPEVIRSLGQAGGGLPTFQGDSPVNIVGAQGISSAFGATVFG